MGELSIEQIVGRCQQGDQQAFGLLYTAMHDRLRRVCRRYVADEATVDDLLHDAFILIFSKIGDLKDVSKAEAWMARVVHNLTQTWLQRHRQESVVSLDALVRPLPAVAPMPTAISYDEILRLVDALPESYRRVFRLSVLEGMSHQEIAALLGIEPHTSSAQLSRAKLLLRRWLRPMVLLLVAALLPLGWLWWHSERTMGIAEQGATVPLRGQGPTAAIADSAAAVTAAETAVSGHRLTPPQVACRVAPPHASIANEAAATETSAETTAETTVKDTAAAGRRLTPPQVDHRVAPPHATSAISATPTSQWAVTLAYSGTNGRNDLQLPYADGETNDAVYDSTCHHRLPLTVGLTVSRALDSHWQLGLGLQYTRLTTDTELGNTYARIVRRQRVQYLGVPLSVRWHQSLTRRLGLYTAANVTLQLPLRSTVESSYVLNGSTVEAATVRLRPGTQWSAGLGLGLQYDVTPAVGFFVEPSLQHYFSNCSGVSTWQTEHPVVLSVPFGIRINIK